MVLYAVVGSLCRGILSGLGVPGIIVQPCGNVKRESKVYSEIEEETPIEKMIEDGNDDGFEEAEEKTEENTEAEVQEDGAE